MYHVVLRYIAKAACKSEDIWGYFYSNYQQEVMTGLKYAFEDYYQTDTIRAHNLAIFVGASLKRLEAYYDVVNQLDASMIDALHPWFLNPVEIAEDDWR